MNTKEITPPDIIRAIFPIKGNEEHLTNAAISYGIVVYPNSNVALFEGSVKELNDLKSILVGGVSA